MRHGCVWAICLALLGTAASLAQPGDIPGWNVTWYDDFDGTSVDQTKWTPIFSTNPTNNSRHAYLPSHVSVSNGNLVLTSTDIPFQHLPYRSGQVISKVSQKYGRWDVRAKLPTSRGMWPAIWLLPDVNTYPWPSGGEIDILENRGDQPFLTSSAFHYGTNPPFQHSFTYHENESVQNGQDVNYHAGFHNYAVEWDSDQLRFYVDDVHYFTVFDDDVGGFLSSGVVEMETVINTAIGGNFLADPDGSTIWPQQFLIDYVHVYEQAPGPRQLTFENGGFDDNGGSLARWSTFGNETPNVQSHQEAVLSGPGSLKLFGQFGPANFSGVEQGITVAAGEEIRALASGLVRSADSIAGSQNSVALKIDYYSQTYGKFGSADYIGSDSVTLVDGTSIEDSWLTGEIRSIVPQGAVEARLALVYSQPNNQGGAVHIDNVAFGRRGDDTATWNGLGNGFWDEPRWNGIQTTAPTDFDNAVVRLNRVTVIGNQQAHHTTVRGGAEAGILHLIGQLTSDVSVETGAAVTGTGQIVGDLSIEGTVLVTPATNLQVSGLVDLTAATLQLESGYSQAPGSFTGPLVLIDAAGVTGTFGIQPGQGAASHLGDSYFLQSTDYSSGEVVVDIYAALPGDANGDGAVDTSDFNIWNANKFQSGTNWLSGDFNGDGFTDIGDFNIWNSNKFTSVSRPVPEPNPLLCLAVVGLVLWKRRHAAV